MCPCVAPHVALAVFLTCVAVRGGAERCGVVRGGAAASPPLRPVNHELLKTNIVSVRMNKDMTSSLNCCIIAVY